MALSFNYTTKHIGVPMVNAQPLLVQDLLNAIRAEEASERGIVESQIVSAAGKDVLSSGVQTSITANLLGTWELEFEVGAYQATITGGNLADALARLYNTGNPQVLILASAAATVVNGSGGSGAPTAAEVAAAVWQRALEDGLSAEQIQRLMLAALSGKTTGIGTSVEQYLSHDGNKTRVTATFDSQGNRATVVTDGTP